MKLMCKHIYFLDKWDMGRTSLTLLDSNETEMFTTIKQASVTEPWIKFHSYR